MPVNNPTAAYYGDLTPFMQEFVDSVPAQNENMQNMIDTTLERRSSTFLPAEDTNGRSFAWYHNRILLYEQELKYTNGRYVLPTELLRNNVAQLKSNTGNCAAGSTTFEDPNGLFVTNNINGGVGPAPPRNDRIYLWEGVRFGGILKFEASIAQVNSETQVILVESPDTALTDISYEVWRERSEVEDGATRIDGNIFFPEGYTGHSPKSDIPQLSGGTGIGSPINEIDNLATEDSEWVSILVKAAPPLKTDRYNYIFGSGGDQTIITAVENQCEALSYIIAALAANPDFGTGTTEYLDAVDALAKAEYIRDSVLVFSNPYTWYTDENINARRADIAARQAQLAARLTDITDSLGAVTTANTYYERRYFWLDQRLRASSGSLTELLGRTYILSYLLGQQEYNTALGNAYESILP